MLSGAYIVYLDRKHKKIAVIFLTIGFSFYFLWVYNLNPFANVTDRVDAIKFWQLYSEDEAKADSMYFNKYIKMDLGLESVKTDDLGITYLISGKFDKSPHRIICITGSCSQGLFLKEGMQVVRFYGQCKGVIGDDIVFDNCIIEKIEQ